MDNVRLLLRGSCTDEHDPRGAYALVELTHEDIKALALKKKAFVEMQKKIGETYDIRLRVLSQQAAFYADIDFAIDDDDTKTHNAKSMLEGMPSYELATTDRVVKFHHKLDTELNLIVIDEDGVFWQSIDDNAIFFTETVSWDVLFEGRL